MAEIHTPIRLALTIAFLFVELPAMCSAQAVDPNGMPYTTEEQAASCRRPTLLHPLASAKLLSCQDSDSVEISLPLKPDSNGLSQEKKVRGPYQFREYQMGKMEQSYAFDSLLDLLPQYGFAIKYSYKPETITARSGDIWVLINITEETYNVTAVQEPPLEWVAVRTAEEISKEVQAHNRVEIYGIEFSPVDQSILEQESQILFQILKYLKQNEGMSIIIESDKFTPNRPPEFDSEITRERANSVLDWLVAHGISRSRVQPRPAGRDNALTENERPSEVQRNERIVIIKAQT